MCIDRYLYSFVLGPQTIAYSRSGESCSLLSGKAVRKEVGSDLRKMSPTHFAIAIVCPLELREPH